MGRPIKPQANYSRQRLSEARCRRLLGRAGENLTPTELGALVDQLRTVACAIIDEFSSAPMVENRRKIHALEADSRELVEERSAILQFEAGMSRETAEQAAISLHRKSRRKGRSSR